MVKWVFWMRPRRIARISWMYASMSMKLSCSNSNGSAIFLEEYLYTSRVMLPNTVSSPVTAVFWPTPDSSLISFRYAKVRFLKGGNTGMDTMDLLRTWTPFILHYVASGVAYDNSKAELGATYFGIAQGMLAKCKAGDVQHGAVRFAAGHRARNW